MKNMHRTFKLSLVSTALVAAFNSAWADEDEIAQYTKPDSAVSIGAGNWSKDRPRQGVYDGMRDDGVYGLLDAEVVKRDDATGTWFMLNGRNLGLDNRELRLDVQRQGDVGGFFEYNRITRDNPIKFITGLQGIGTSTVTHGTQFGAFPRSEVTLGTERDLMRFGGFKNLAPGLDFRVDFKNEEKSGARHFGWGSAALFSAEPIDYRTRQLEAVLQYRTKQLQVAGGYYGTWFTNRNSVLFEQLNGVTGGTSPSFAAVTPVSLPLDNHSHQVFLDGDYTFTPTTQGNFKVAYGRASQDEGLATFTGANAPFAGVPSSLDGRIDTTTIQVGVTSRPLPKLSVLANLRYHDMDDKTPVRQYIQSVSGNAPNTTTTRVYNTPHSFKTTAGKLEATYRLPEGFNLTGGVDYSTQDRSTPSPSQTQTANATNTTTVISYVPFRTELKELTYRLQLRRSLAEDLNGTLAYLHSDRDGGSYVNANGTAFANQINPLNIADRQRDKLRFALDWNPLERLSVQFAVEESRDKYADDGRPYGLKKGNASLYAIDGTYSFSENWKASAWYSYDQTKTREVSVRASGNPATADAIKTARIKQVGNSFGADLKGAITGRLEVGAGIEWFQNDSSYPQDIARLNLAVPAIPAGMSPLPDIKTNLTRLKLNGKYALDKSSDLRLDLIQEWWHADDWTWRFANGDPFSYYSGNINCAGCNGAVGNLAVNVLDGTTTLDKRTQNATFVGLRYIYKFQ